MSGRIASAITRSEHDRTVGKPTILKASRRGSAEEPDGLELSKAFGLRSLSDNKLLHDTVSAQRQALALRMQQTYGNSATARLLFSFSWRNSASSMPVIQRQATEEDEEVMMKAKATGSSLVQRQSNEEEEENEVQAKARPGSTLEAEPDIGDCIADMRGRGRPLPESFRMPFEQQLGYDFGQVRVHPARNAMIQAKLTVGAQDDQYELEADRVADHVLGMPNTGHAGDSVTPGQLQHPQISRLSLGSNEGLLHRQEAEEEKELQAKAKDTRLVQRQAEEEDEQPVQAKAKSATPIQRQAEEEEEGTLQAKRSGQNLVDIGQRLADTIDAVQRGGEPLTESTRSFFEPRFGCDFSRVRIHADAAAAETAQAINARAFTLGRDVVLGPGENALDSEAGRRLLAHELTHVVQQTGSGDRRGAERAEGTTAQTKSPTAPAEKMPLVQGAVDDTRVQRQAP